MAETLREYCVKLGWIIDSSGQAQFETAMLKVTTMAIGGARH
jgi:hypothetical protein